MSERTLLSGRSWAGKLVPKPPRRCHPPVSFSFSPLVLLPSLRLIDRDDLLFRRRRSSSVIHAAALPTHPLTDGVNHESYSKLWQRLCVRSFRQHVSALITRHPALNICCLTPVATELANKDVYQRTPPFSSLVNTHGAFCNIPHDTELLIHSLPAHRRQEGELRLTAPS